MKLLKIGSLNMPQNRWMDALDVFSEIDVFCRSTAFNNSVDLSEISQISPELVLIFQSDSSVV